MTNVFRFAAIIGLSCACACKGAPTDGATSTTTGAQSTKTAESVAQASVYDLTVPSLGGKPQPLAAYRGKVSLIVNTASECGFTPQYAGLEALAKSFAGKDFVLLGFPSNDFGAQEPGTDDDIAKFTTKDYGITFPLFSKSDVVGEKTNPVFALLGKNLGAPKWNFHKYVVDKKGVPAVAYPSSVKPDDPALRTEIEMLLAKSD